MAYGRPTQCVQVRRLGLLSIVACALLLGDNLDNTVHETDTQTPTKDTQGFFIDHQNNLHLAQLDAEYFLCGGVAALYRWSSQSARSVPMAPGEVHSLDTHITQRLPRYRKLFRQVARQYHMDWRLVAAISYQESHWHSKAQSPTGVRGLMMLTLTTARELGIRNRLDPRQSVQGGVRYLQQLKKRLPKSLIEPDRTWQALAAYNLGIGHLYDARDLAVHQGHNPDHWAELKDSLLKLEEANWYEDTQHGYARGAESVRYVENIRRYYLHITKTLANEDPPYSLAQRAQTVTPPKRKG